MENPPPPEVKKEDTSTDTPPSTLPTCKPNEGGQRRMCIPPTTTTEKEVDRSLGIPRNIPIPPKVKAGDGKRLIQTTSYGEYIQMKRQYAGDSNVIVQSPFTGSKPSASTPFSGGWEGQDFQSANLSSGSLGARPPQRPRP